MGYGFLRSLLYVPLGFISWRTWKVVGGGSENFAILICKRHQDHGDNVLDFLLINSGDAYKYYK